MIEVKPLRNSDIINVSTMLTEESERDAKVLELESFRAISKLVDSSVSCWAIFCRGDLIAVAGVTAQSFMSDTVYPWLALSVLMDKHRVAFVRHSKYLLRALLKEHRSLHGFVDPSHVKAVRWIKWLGFDLTDDECGYYEFRHEA